MLSKLGALRKFYGRYGDFIKRYEVPLSRMLHDFWRMVIYSDTIHLSDITPIALSPNSWHVLLHVVLLTSFHCDVTIAQPLDGPFDCDVTMKKSANRCNVGPLAKGQLFTLLLISTLLLNLTFHLNLRGFHRTFAKGAACQERTLTIPDTWSYPNCGLASVL